MTVAARALRLDEPTWRGLSVWATPVGAGLVVLSAYLVFAFDRFGWPDFAVRPTVRLMLTGLYGWIGLAAASWLIARRVFASSGAASMLIRLTGHAHLPLLFVAVFIQVVSVTLDISNMARWPALFAGLFWMPAMLVNALAVSSGLDRPRAALAVAVPYLVWVAVVGRLLWRHLHHLL